MSLTANSNIRHPSHDTWCVFCFFLFFCLGLQPVARGQSPEPPTDTENTTVEQPKRFQEWLEEVDTLITLAEKRLFLSLTKDYQRDAFIQAFWKVRDPYPRTARNELKERWPVTVASARSRFGSLTDDRARILLTHGDPAGGFAVKCTTTRSPAEVWAYQGSERVDFSFVVIFVRLQGTGEARIWRPSTAGIGFNNVLSRSRGCINGGRLGQVMSLISTDSDNYERTLLTILAKPRPKSEEWIHTFVASSTDLPADAELLNGTVEFAFPGRHQHRTVVQGLLKIPTRQAVAAEFAGYASYDFQLTGEVVTDDTLFENFRYKFGVPAKQASDTLPLAFQRYLRPGSYRIILRLDDLNSKRVFRDEIVLEIPQAENQIEVPTFTDPLTAKLFEEATAAIEAGQIGIRIIPPQSELQTGFTRFDTLTSGDSIQKVRFFLDDKLILTKNRPPYNVELDLGAFPDLHTLRVEALDVKDQEVASDELLINSGGYRFLVRLIEPREGKRYTNSLRAQVEVEVPEGRVLDRIELFLNENRVATLFQEPYVHPLVLPPEAEIAYVRAVAFLPDGNSTEDLVFINAPDYLEELDIQFVELYTTVLDHDGRPIENLTVDRFSVLENGSAQSIARFEKVENLPIHVGIMIDNSASMVGTLDDARKAALRFLQNAVTPRDRAAVITFNSFPHLAVKLTSDRSALGSGLAGLSAEGQTALYDSLMFGLYYFTGIKGQRALLVLSDGKDESSRFSFEETLEYARRAGITLYSIGLRLTDPSARRKLATLADETGGRSFFIRNITELEGIYSIIQKELRSQYLIAYQSSNTAQDGQFRSVELKVDEPGATVKTLSGYYP